MFMGSDFLKMSNMDEKKLKIEEKLATLRFICDNKTHIKIDTDKCKKCKTKNCLYFCPASVYNIEDGEEIPSIEYENCLECGTCRISCPHNAIEWNNPKGSHGVRYRFG